jgi:hypothetical protein
MLDSRILEELQDYIQNHLVMLSFEVCEVNNYNESEILHSIELEDFIKNNRKPTLQEVLFGFIDQKGVSDPDIYKKAGMDRKHFSKIRSNPNYRPGKNTIITLAIALELNKKETDKLLSSAGYTLSDSDTYDLVVQFCLEKKIYNFDHINQALDYFSLKPLTGIF